MIETTDSHEKVGLVNYIEHSQLLKKCIVGDRIIGCVSISNQETLVIYLHAVRASVIISNK